MRAWAWYKENLPAGRGSANRDLGGGESWEWGFSARKVRCPWSLGAAKGCVWGVNPSPPSCHRQPSLSTLASLSLSLLLLFPCPRAIQLLSLIVLYMVSQPFSYFLLFLYLIFLSSYKERLFFTAMIALNAVDGVLQGAKEFSLVVSRPTYMEVMSFPKPLSCLTFECLLYCSF